MKTDANLVGEEQLKRESITTTERKRKLSDLGEVQVFCYTLHVAVVVLHKACQKHRCKLGALHNFCDLK